MPIPCSTPDNTIGQTNLLPGININISINDSNIIINLVLTIVSFLGNEVPAVEKSEIAERLDYGKISALGENWLSRVRCLSIACHMVYDIQYAPASNTGSIVYISYCGNRHYSAHCHTG